MSRGLGGNNFYNEPSTLGFTGRQRTASTSSLDPYEDPAYGLERVGTVRQRRPRPESHPSQRVEDYPKEESALSSKYESLNYEICENELYKMEEKSEQHQVTLWRKSRNRWLACFYIGISTAVIGAVVDILVHKSSQIKHGYVLGPLAQGCDGKLGCMWMVQAAWMVYNCVLVAVAALMVIFISPIAGGSGIPQIKCFLNGIHVPEVVRLKTLLVKSIGVSCAVGGGLCAGKEGPMIHSGGAIGAGVSQGRISSLGIDFGFFRDFRNDRDKRDFVSAGAAAGVAAAFGAPIGGVLFSLEEGASFWNQALTWRMFFSAMVSCFTLNTILSMYHEKTGFLSWTGLANFGVFENNNYTIQEIPFFLIMAVIGGFTGSLFNALNRRITLFRKKYVSNPWQRLFECLLVAATSAFVGFLTIVAIDDCVPMGVNTLNHTDLTKLYCKKGEYSAVANLFFQNPEESVKLLFHSPMNSFRPLTLLVFSMEYFILTLWTFGISVPAGVFIPALLTGAAWGRLFGVGVRAFFPGFGNIDPGKYALIGAAAQLGGIVRMTISLTAILMEATKDITFGLPIMLVLMVTKWVGDMFNEGLYDMLIELGEIPVLGWNAPKMARNILAEQVMRSDVVSVEKRERVHRLMGILEKTSHHGFPVVDRIDESMSGPLPDYGRLEGMILRSQVIGLLKMKAFEGSGILLSTDDFSDNPSMDTISISVEEEQCWVDFSPYMHPHPHRVPLNASLPFIFNIFRGLGLRYMMVVNEDNRLRGVITRKDVARYRETNSRTEYGVTELYISESADR